MARQTLILRENEDDDDDDHEQKKGCKISLGVGVPAGGTLDTRCSRLVYEIRLLLRGL